MSRGGRWLWAAAVLLAVGITAVLWHATRPRLDRAPLVGEGIDGR